MTALSRELNVLALHPDAGTRDNFRNANGVAMKLANFAAIDPNHDGRGLTGFSAGDLETWREYATDTDLLDREATRIRAAHEVAASTSNDSHEAVSSASMSLGSGEGSMSRRAQLLQRFSAWLLGQGHHVDQRSYPIGTSSLEVELYDLNTGTTWEVVGSVSRTAIRSAIGTLIDLGRFDPAGRLGLVLPWAPSDDLQMLLRAASVSCAVPLDADTFEIT